MKLESGAHVTENVRLVRPLGEGGMGVVWVADHLTIGREVAVKFLTGHYAEDANTRARFAQEAAATSQVKSAHVVQIFDYGVTDTGTPFIVMELLEGVVLADRLEAFGSLSVAEVVPVVTQLCKALARAHDKGIIHRDIKPENVFLCREGDGEVFVKLLDFGVAKSERLSPSSAARKSTQAGAMIGTPFYMSPEQIIGSKQIDSQSDLWSVGVLVYQVLTGALPFVADTVGGLAIKINEAAPPPPSRVNPRLPVAIDAWFAKACARAPGDRFASASQLAEALRTAVGYPRSSRDSLPPWDEVSDASVSTTESARIVIRPDKRRASSGLDRTATSGATLGEATGAPVSSPEAPAADPMARGGKRRRAALGVAAVTAIAAAGFFALTRTKGDAPTASATAASFPPVSVTATFAPSPTPPPEVTAASSGPGAASTPPAPAASPPARTRTLPATKTTTASPRLPPTKDAPRAPDIF
jgi:serine/threonine-protein kinase